MITLSRFLRKMLKKQRNISLIFKSKKIRMKYRKRSRMRRKIKKKERKSIRESNGKK